MTFFPKCWKCKQNIRFGRIKCINNTYIYSCCDIDHHINTCENDTKIKSIELYWPTDIDSINKSTLYDNDLLFINDTYVYYYYISTN